MLSKLASKAGHQGILGMITATQDKPAAEGKEDDSMLEIGVQLIKMLIDELDGDISAWFASLIGKTPEEYDAMPFDVELDIIELLKTSGELEHFFTRASQLFKTIRQ
jgi:hypothetical protein